jgi:hypothetical protein
MMTTTQDEKKNEEDRKIAQAFVLLAGETTKAALVLHQAWIDLAWKPSLRAISNSITSG